MLTYVVTTNGPVATGLNFGVPGGPSYGTIFTGDSFRFAECG